MVQMCDDSICMVENSEVIYNEIRSVTPDMLENLYTQASGM